MLLIALWPLRAIVATYPQIRRYGEEVQRETGKGRFRQFLEQLWLILCHHIAPKHYYRFRLYLPNLRWQARYFLLRNQIDGFVYPLLQNRGATRSQPLKDKLKFAEHCHANGLPHVPTLMLFARNRQHFLEEALAGRDLFVKPVSGSRGKGAERWTSSGDRYRNSRGRELDRPALLRHLAKVSQRQPFLVQPAVRNHPAFRDLTAGALCTMRLISWRNEAGTFEVTDAFVRMPVDPASPVDNTHAGAISTAIDIETGTLARGTDMAVGLGNGWHDLHPVTGAQITGRRLPLWHETLAPAKRAHEAFDRHIVIGWDIAVLEDAPHLIEGNERPGVSMQRDIVMPLGNRRFGALVAYHLRPYLGT